MVCYVVCRIRYEPKFKTANEKPHVLNADKYSTAAQNILKI